MLEYLQSQQTVKTISHKMKSHAVRAYQMMRNSNGGKIGQRLYRGKGKERDIIASLVCVCVWVCPTLEKRRVQHLNVDGD